jgi:hypothetical protein
MRLIGVRPDVAVDDDREAAVGRDVVLLEDDL